MSLLSFTPENPFCLQKQSLVIILALLLAFCYIQPAWADGPGDLDLTFNSTGIVTTSINSSVDIGDSITVQPDGKIVVAGSTRINTVDAFTVIRYNPDGSLDTQFNSTGIVTTPVENNAGRQSVAIQPDGKIVVAGRSSGAGFGHIAVVRYNPNGSLDTGFGSTGIVTTSVGTFARGVAVAITNQKIVVVGSSGSVDFCIVRYSDNGSLDPTFNGSGIVTTTIGALSAGQSVTIQSDQKIVVAGITNDGSNDDLAIARYNPDGSLDHDLNGTGIVTTPITFGNDIGYGVALQTNGKIAVVGETPVDGKPAIAVARYLVDGTLDTTLNGSGIVTTPIGQGSAAAGLVIQPDRKIVVGGVVVENGKSNVALVRYNVDGNLDTSFKHTGIVTTPVGLNNGIGRAIAIQPDGRLLVTGFSNDGAGGSDVVVVRYLGNHFDYLPVILKSN